MPDLAPAVRTVIHRCLAVKPDEEVLVVVDAGTRVIGEALRDEGKAAGGDVVLAVMEAREIDGNEPPATIAGALERSDVFIAPTIRSLSHTTARKRASEAGARGATMPGVTEEMLARAMAIDFELMAARSRAVAAVLDAGKEARITCPRGSDLTLEIGERRGIADDGDLTARGAFGNLPCGEGFIAPQTGAGKLVVGSVGRLGITPEPATLIVEDGKLVAAEGGLGPDLLDLLARHGEEGRNVAELGVGTNDRARLTGLVLEDEKILGTAHVAFGASAGIGGTVSVPIHLDVVVLEPSLEVDGRPVLEQGRFALDA
jgi:leucyl aminopeptidase (aminopeptidase T)